MFSSILMTKEIAVALFCVFYPFSLCDIEKNTSSPKTEYKDIFSVQEYLYHMQHTKYVKKIRLGFLKITRKVNTGETTAAVQPKDD